MGDDTEWLKLPTDEKITHKAWKARIAGYEECIKQFGMLDEKSPEFSKYLGLVKKMVTETNAIAQEKAVEAVLIFAENAHIAGKTAGEVCSGIVLKCLNSSRTKTREKAFEILLMYVEIERQDVVQDELMKGLSNKQPKIVVGCVQALTMALRDYGNKIIQVKPLIKPMQRLLEDRDKNVRDETKQLVIQMYRWVGAALKPQLAGLKPVQLQELEAEFEKLPSSKVQQARFLRSQQDLKEKAEAAAAAGSDAEEEDDEDEADGAAAVDPYDLMEPVDILSKLPKDFYEKIEAKKWQDRRESLEALEKLVENPKLESGDYNDLMRALKRVIAKDTNILLVTLATKITAKLAAGLRKKFAPFASQMLESLLEKFREKKVTVVAALVEAVDAIYPTTTLDAISETVVEMLVHKTPSVRAETAQFLARCFQRCTTATLPKKLLKLFVAPLVKNKDDSDGKVREAAYAALGTAMKVVSEKAMMPFLGDVDSLKMAKIKESYEQATLLTGGKPKPEKAKPEPKAASPPAKKTAAPASKAIRGGGAKAKGSKGAKGGPAKKGGAKGKAGAAAKEEAMEHALSDEAVEDKMGGLLPAETLAGLANSNWKERLASIEKFTQVVKTLEKAEIPTQACVRTITKKPGLKETNFQVLKLRVELIAHLATNSNFTKRSAEFCVVELVDKLGDVKNGAAVKECLSCTCEACGLEFISQQVIASAFEQKNPKNQAEALVWLAMAIKEFGFKVNIKPMLQNIKKAFAHTNPAVRTAAITLVGVAYMYMGPPLRVFFEDEKAALLQQIDAEIEKVKGEKPPAATRGLVASEPGGVEEDEEAEEEGEGGADAVNVADLVPRNDISNELGESLMSEMADKNWKVRNEALQKVITILNQAKFITPNIGPLPESLKLRLGDSNKILVNTTLGICTTLAQAMGPNVKQHVRIVGPGIVACMGDSKPQVRANAVTCINAWVEQTNLVPWVEAELFSDALKLENPNLRNELLGWLSEKLPNHKKLPADEMKLCIPHLFACLEDRNGEVRKKAQEAVLPFMIHTGFESMARAAGKLKPSSKDQVMQHLEKAKPNLPAKPTKAKVVKPAAAAAAPAPVHDEPEPEETPAEAPVVKGGGGKAKGKPGSAAAKKGAAAASNKKKKGEEEEDTGPPLKCNNLKETRFKEEKALKVLKWNFTTPRAEFVEQLRTQMDPSFGTSLLTMLFHADFKQHVKAMELLTKCVETMPDAVTANLDLLLKWITLRFFDTNTSVLLKILEFLQASFNSLAEDDYHLTEMEASSFIPYLVNKVGDPKDNIRRDIRILFKLICKVYPASKMFSYLLDGLKSKNAKQRTECLEELGTLIEIYGINVCQPSPAGALKVIAGQISDRDKSVRSAALNTCVTAHDILGENIYKYVGKLNDKDLDMLEERIKRAAKSRPNSVVRTSPQEEKPQKVVKKEAPAQKVSQDNRVSGMQQRSAVKKEFYLELDENEDGENYNAPSLIEHNLEDVLAEPVPLPKSRARPPSPSMKLITGSTDAKSAIDLVISQVASNDVTISIQALAQIDEVLKDDEKSEMMSEHVDQFLVSCSLQLRMTYSKHMSADSGQENVIRLYRCLLASLLALLQRSNLAQEASRDVLRDLIFTLITILLDNRVADLEDGPQLIRTVNIVVVKIVSNADHTNIMSALLKLLHESVGNETCSSRFLELIMKCLWKMVRMLPSIINSLAVERTLCDVHQFLQAFPSHTWRTRSSDIPLRTVKTILHSLAKLKGNKIMSYMSLIDNPQDSEMEAYLQKVLKNGLDLNSTPHSKHDQVNGTTEGVQLRTPRKESTSSSSSSSSRRLSKTTHDMLAEIFKKIGSKENTKEGLNDLYDFKLKFPEADLEPFLKKSSAVFQSYIERGLKNIEVEREGKVRVSQGQSPLTTSNSAGALSSQMGQDGDTEVNPAFYMERLKALRAKCGLDRTENSAVISRSQEKLESATTSHTGSSSSLPQVSTGLQEPCGNENQPPLDAPQSAAANLMDLKKRLERIKKTNAN